MLLFIISNIPMCMITILIISTVLITFNKRLGGRKRERKKKNQERKENAFCIWILHI